MIRGKEYSASVSVPYASAWGEGKGSGQRQLSTPAGELVRGIVSLISFCQPLLCKTSHYFKIALGHPARHSKILDAYLAKYSLKNACLLFLSAACKFLTDVINLSLEILCT